MAGLLLAALGVAGALLLARSGERPPRAVQATALSTSATPAARHATPRRPRSAILIEHRTGSLRAPVQDAAAVTVGPHRVMLLGGLTAADTSRSDILIASGSRDRGVGSLSTPLHDTAAARLGSEVYLFGGGTGSNTQSDEILRIPAAGGNVTRVGRLPAPSSDHSAVRVGRTIYVIGGYTGSRWLDTIVAWRPGTTAHVVAHLPQPLRYAAVAAVGNRIVVAGGSLEDGGASETVLQFVPSTGRIAQIGRLPAPTTHAAAATLGGIAYVIGGRGPVRGTPTDRIVAIQPLRKSVRAAGALLSPRSDLAAAALGGRILLAGGTGSTGTEATLSELVPRRSGAPARSSNVYAADAAGALTGPAKSARSLVYVPNSGSNTVDVIDPRTFRIVAHFAVGGLPQHVVPAWDLRTLYVTNDTGNSLTPLDPREGRPRRGSAIPVEDPYNMYFTPDGRFAIVVAERLRRLDFRDARTLKLRHSLPVPCAGVDHMDFTADGRFLLASCEFSGQLVRVDVARQKVVRTIALPNAPSGMPQDVKLSPDGSVFYVADLRANGLWEIDARSFEVLGRLPTGSGAHGLYPSRDAKLLYVTNRSEGTISVVSFRKRKVVATWRIPGGGSPDMGGVSADGKVLWVSGRYNAEVYALSTANGKLLARIRVGAGPHGLCVWPQPGRYSLGHTGILR